MRAQTMKLARDDRAWTSVPQVWAVHTAQPTKIAHRIEKAATPEGSTGYHVTTTCGSYLSRAALYFDSPAGIDECDECLMGDTVYHLVYELRSPEGECVYVGYSSELVNRLHKHRRESWWWTRDLKVTWTVYDTEIEARAAEVATILRLKPVHNVAANGGGPRTAPLKATLHVRTAVLTTLVAAALNIPEASLTNPQMANFLGVNTSTCYRIRNDPDYVVSSSFVAQVMTLFGGFPDGLFEARESLGARLASVA